MGRGHGTRDSGHGNVTESLVRVTGSRNDTSFRDSISIGAQIQKELFGEFNQFFKRFKNLKSNKLLSSRFFADEGSPMEGRVAATWNSFAEVRVALICVHSYSNFVSGL